LEDGLQDDLEEPASDSPLSAVPHSSSSEEDLGNMHHSSQLPKESNFSYQVSKVPNRPNDAGENELPEHVSAHFRNHREKPKRTEFSHIPGMEEYEQDDEDKDEDTKKRLAMSKEKKRAGILISKPQSVNANPYMLSPHVCFEA